MGVLAQLPARCSHSNRKRNRPGQYWLGRFLYPDTLPAAGPPVRGYLTFGELWSLTGFAQTHFLTLYRTRVTGYVTRFAQGAAQTFIVIHQCPGQTMANRARLTKAATTAKDRKGTRLNSGHGAIS